MKLRKAFESETERVRDIESKTKRESKRKCVKQKESVTQRQSVRVVILEK